MDKSDQERLASVGFELKTSSTKSGILAGVSHFELTEPMISALEETQGVEELVLYASKVSDENLLRAAKIPGIKKIGLLACRGYSDKCKKTIEESLQVSEFK